MNVGFTGTRKGMSTAQQEQLTYVLALLNHADQAVGRPSPAFHHGGADGADSEAALFARRSGCLIYVHPCPGVVRDPQDPYLNDHWLEVLPPLTRNKHIVEACDVLIAAPLVDTEQQRSGTWATVRYARAARKPVIMLSRGVK